MYKNKTILVPRFKENNGFYTTKAHSRLMSKIKSENTKPEIKFRKFLWNLGLRYRVNVKNIIGKPDIVFKKYKLIIFIDGDFWHGFNWKEKKKRIKSNRDYWIPKIERNIQRDKEQMRELESQGYKVLRFWEHEINKNFEECISKVLEELNYK